MAIIEQCRKTLIFSTVGGAPVEAVKQYIENQELYKRPKKE